MPLPVVSRSGEQLREELLVAAAEILSRRLAVSAPSLRETARACGVSATAVYRYFPSQQALLSAIAHQSLASLESVMRAPSSPSERHDTDATTVHLWAQSYVRWAVESPGGYQLLFEGRDLLADPEPIEERLARLQLLLETALELLSPPLTSRQEQAELLWTALHGLVVVRIRKPAYSPSRSLEDETSAMVDVFLSPRATSTSS